MTRLLEVKPKFYMPHDVLLKKGKIIFECAENDLNELTRYDPDYNQDYLKRFNEAITEAESLPTDRRVKSLMDQLSLKLEYEMGKCKELSRKIKNTLGHIFYENEEILDEFGLADYPYSRDNHARMIYLMKYLYDGMQKHKQMLIKNGITEEIIEDIGHHHQLLRQAYQEHELFIKSLGVTTKRKVIKLNTLWNFVKGISNIGKLAFREDFTKYQRYILLDDDGKKELNFNGKVAGGHTLLLYDQEVNPTWIFTLKNIGESTLSFGLGDNDFSHFENGIVLGKREEIIVNVSDLGTGSFLKVTNKNHSIEGIYEVSVN